ncbi:MATE family efflux transporter [Methanobrevibacter sp.]|uniref:MATE family efflux transporter n=1 Tax=Methanobrevibacter sp. TaxID=66852 RepID=UPI00388D50E6
MSKTGNIELITGDPKRAIVKLSVPMMLTMFLLTLYNLADSIWVAGIGPDALAAIGFISPMYMVLIGLGNGIGAGANSLIARYIGSKDYAQANNAALHGVLLSVVISIISTVVLVGLMDPILMVLGAGKTLEIAGQYSIIIFSFIFVFIFIAVASSIFRSEGDMKRGTIPIVLAAILNIVLDPIFIYVFGWGIAGAGWATVLAASLSAIVMAYWMFVKKDMFLDLSFKNFNYRSSMVYDTLYIAVPSTLENILISAFGVVVNNMLAIVDGTSAVAIYTVALRMSQVSQIPLSGISTALLTVSGVSYGASNPENLNVAYSYSIKFGLAISTVIAVLMVIFSPQLASVFAYSTASASLLPDISTAISILTLYLFVIPMGVMSSMMFQGVGKGLYSLLIGFMRFLLLGSIFSYLFGFVFGWGVTGIYAGSIFGCFVGGICAFIMAKSFIYKFKKISGENEII